MIFIQTDEELNFRVLILDLILLQKSFSTMNHGYCSDHPQIQWLYYLLRKVGAQWKGRVARERERESIKKEEERRTSSFDGLIG